MAGNNNDLVLFGIDLTQLTMPDYTNPQIIEHKRLFEDWLEQNHGKNTSYVQTRAEIEEVHDILKGNFININISYITFSFNLFILGLKTISDHQKKYRFRKKQYSLKDGVVYRTAKVDKSSGNVTLPVIFKENFYEKIYGLHCSQRGHQGNILYFYYLIIYIIYYLYY